MATAADTCSRQCLADYLDRRVTVRGFFERLTDNPNPRKDYKVALLQEVQVIVDGHTLDIGHTWIQRAENFNPLPLGRMVECTCRVHEYRKRLDAVGADGVMHQTVYGLTLPQQVRPLQEPPALTIPASAPPPSPPQPSRVEQIEEVEEPTKDDHSVSMVDLAEVKALIRRIGLKRLKSLIELLAN